MADDRVEITINLSHEDYDRIAEMTDNASLEEVTKLLQEYVDSRIELPTGLGGFFDWLESE